MSNMISVQIKITSRIYHDKVPIIDNHQREQGHCIYMNPGEDRRKKGAGEREGERKERGREGEGERERRGGGGGGGGGDICSITNQYTLDKINEHTITPKNIVKVQNIVNIYT